MVLSSLLKEKGATSYAFQEEIGESGTPHLQGVVSFSRRVRPAGLVGIPAIHWEVRRGSRKQAEAYALKDETRNGEQWTWDKSVYEDKLMLTYEQLRPWQRGVWDLIVQTEPDDRTVHVYVDYEGGHGKTRLARTLGKLGHAALASGKAADAGYMLSEIEVEDWPKAVIIDIPMECETIPISLVEQLKGGILCSTKYKSCIKYTPACHVIIMTNHMPDTSRLAKDRWKITVLGDGQ